MNAEGMAPGTVLGRRFELLRLAGAGGMGAVYHARDLATGQPVAVKVLLRPADTARFAREARLLEAVRHPAVVRYVAEGTTSDGAPHLVMDGLERGRGPSPPPAGVLDAAGARTGGGARSVVRGGCAGEALVARLERGPLTVEETVTLARRVAEALVELHARGVLHRDLKPSNLF